MDSSSSGALSQQPEPLYTRTSTTAILSLISGLLAWFGVFGLGGILAVIFGHLAKNEIKKGAGLVSGDGLATAGLVLGYLNIALSLCGLCFFLLILIGAISAPALCLPFMNDLNLDYTMIP